MTGGWHGLGGSGGVCCGMGPRGLLAPGFSAIWAGGSSREPHRRSAGTNPLAVLFLVVDHHRGLGDRLGGLECGASIGARLIGGSDGGVVHALGGSPPRSGYRMFGGISGVFRIRGLVYRHGHRSSRLGRTSALADPADPVPGVSGNRQGA